MKPLPIKQKRNGRKGRRRKPRTPKIVKEGTRRIERPYGGRTRLDFINLRRAYGIARGQTTMIARQGKQYEVDPRSAENLKNSVVKMAEFADADPETLEKIYALDQDKLAQLATGNRVLFEIYFRYPIEAYDEELGIYMELGMEKEQDIKFLISEYERLYGEI